MTQKINNTALSTALSAVIKLVDEILEIDGVKHVKFKNGLMITLLDETKRESDDEWVKDWCDLPQSIKKRIKEDALSYVMQLADLMAQPCVNGDWKPDWNNDTRKWCIKFDERGLSVECLILTGHFLAFKHRETAEKFLLMYKSYIEKSAPILFGVDI